MGTPLTIKKWRKRETAHKKSLASRLATQKMCSKSLIYSHWLSPISLCLYRIRSFIVVGHKLFYISFKNATIDFIIIIVKTLFLYNITLRMPYFVTSDELTLATFVFEPETFLPWLVVRNSVYMYYYTLNLLSLFWLAESVQWIFEISAWYDT